MTSITSLQNICINEVCNSRAIFGFTHNGGRLKYEINYTDEDIEWVRGGGTVGVGLIKYCYKHKLSGCVNLVYKKCEYRNCDTRAVIGREGRNKRYARYCISHDIGFGFVNIINRVKAHEGNLIDVFEDDNVEAIVHFVENNNKSIKTVSEMLTLACEYMCINIIKYLISELHVCDIMEETGDILDSYEYGLNYNKDITGLRSGENPLMKAAFTGDIEIVSTLIDARAKIELIDDHWETALMKASFVGNTDVVRLLIDNGADVLKKDNGYVNRHYDDMIIRDMIMRVLNNNNRGKNAMTGAAVNGHFETVSIIYNSIIHRNNLAIIYTAMKGLRIASEQPIGYYGFDIQLACMIGDMASDVIEGSFDYAYCNSWGKIPDTLKLCNLEMLTIRYKFPDCKLRTKITGKNIGDYTYVGDINSKCSILEFLITQNMV